MKEQLSRFLNPVALAKLGNISLLARLVVEGFITGLHHSPYKGFSVEFAEHKQYTPGDDLKHIDWKVYAKSNKYYLKQYEEETNLRSTIILDTSASMSFSSGKVSKLEYGCYLTGCLAYMMIRQQDSVGFVSYSENVDNYIPPKSSPKHLKAIVSRLERVLPGANKTRSSNVLHDLAERVKKRGLIILISDLLDDPGEIMKGLIHFRHKKHELIVFHVLDENEINFNYDEMAVFRDLEEHTRIQVDPRTIRQNYLKLLNEFISKLKRECGENNIDYVLVDTSKPFDEILLSYLSKRIRMG